MTRRSGRASPPGGDDPDARPGKPAKRRPINIGRHHDQASTMACLPGISDNHPDQLWHFNPVSLAWAAVLHELLRKTTLSRVVLAGQHPQLPRSECNRTPATLPAYTSMPLRAAAAMMGSWITLRRRPLRDRSVAWARKRARSGRRRCRCVG